MQITKLFVPMLLLITMKANAQDPWKKIVVKGTVTYSSVTVSKQFANGEEVINRSETESSFTSDQVFTFFVDRFGYLAGNYSKLVEYNNANSNALLMGDNIGGQSLSTDVQSPTPIAFFTGSKSWGLCYNEDSKTFKQLSISEASDNLKIHGSRTSLRMIPIRTQQDANLDKILAKSLDKFAQSMMAAKKENDIKAGKKINEDDYFVPANLYRPNTFGLYLFTSLWQQGSFSTSPTLTREKYYDCSSKKWLDREGKIIATVASSEKLEENTDEEGTIDHTRYVSIDIDDFREFAKNPKRGGTFTGGSLHYSKDYTGEQETRTIITLIIKPSN